MSPYIKYNWKNVYWTVTFQVKKKIPENINENESLDLVLVYSIITSTVLFCHIYTSGWRSLFVLLKAFWLNNAQSCRVEVTTATYEKCKKYFFLFANQTSQE